jgi:hypothetical protein
MSRCVTRRGFGFVAGAVIVGKVKGNVFAQDDPPVPKTGPVEAPF